MIDSTTEQSNTPLAGLHQPAALKNQAINRIETLQNDLWEVSQKLFFNPEIAFEEHKSAALLAGQLDEAGFEVELGIGGLETAFQAIRKGNGKGPVIAFLAEYDALPGLGHACGHHLVATASLGAGLGMLAVINELAGEIRVIGTPAEERGGGKRILTEAGVFNDVDAAMRIHPGTKNMILRGSLASVRIKFEFFGRAAHAAAYPQKGINALEACILTFSNINALRQHLEPRDKIAGIIINGGEAANIIPAFASAEFSVRSPTEKLRDQLLSKVVACAEGAALATGCKVENKILPGYAETIPNRVIANLFGENLRTLGREVIPPKPDEPMGSTDMGPVSHRVPAIHPYLETVPLGTSNHTPEFRDLCISESGQVTMLDGAKAMAMTAIDLLCDPGLTSKARAELDEQLTLR